MGKIHQQDNWVIRVQGNEHPPTHVHLIAPDGKAIIYLDGSALNSGVPQAALKAAQAWVVAHTEIILAEWARMNNPPARQTGEQP